VHGLQAMQHASWHVVLTTGRWRSSLYCFNLPGCCKHGPPCLAQGTATPQALYRVPMLPYTGWWMSTMHRGQKMWQHTFCPLWMVLIHHSV